MLITVSSMNCIHINYRLKLLHAVKLRISKYINYIFLVSVEAVVEFDYQGVEDDELTIEKGDIITDVIKHDGGWWEGACNGKKGMFPDNFVKVSSIASEMLQNYSLLL